MRLLVVAACIPLLFAGCAVSPDAAPAPPEGSGAVAPPADDPGSATQALDGEGSAASFEPVVDSWEGSTQQGACVIDPDGNALCAAAPFGECCHASAIPPAAGTLSLVVTWQDELSRPLNVAVYGVSESGVIERGASPLTIELPIAAGSTEASVYVEQYVADAGAANVSSAVSFHAEATFTA